MRYLTNATLGRRGKYRNLDVQNAYFEGRKVPPDEPGGRSLWAPVPEGWEFMGYRSRADDGSRNWFEITGNVPGLRDAGRTWGADCDAFLLAEGFIQSIMDRRVFIKQLTPIPGETLFIVGVYVDDYWTYCEDDDAWDDFFTKWSARYTASSANVDGASDFCGTSFTHNPIDGSMSLGCGKLMASMDLLLAPFGPAPDTYDTPMAADALQRIRDPVAPNNLLVDNVAAARSILGLGLYITRGVRVDCLFPALALSPYIVNHLTDYVWRALLRWAFYLVQTRDMCLVLRPPSPLPPNRPLCPTPGIPDFAACSDSSLINAPVTSVAMPDVAAASYGGFALYFEGSGAFSVECFSPRRLADSSAGAELIMATWAGKSIVAFQILHRELGMTRLSPTPLQIDASAVTDGVKMERVSRKMRFTAARLGMLRYWQQERIIRLLKTDTEDMRADILSKPVNPIDKFGPKQLLLLTGLSSSLNPSKSSAPRRDVKLRGGANGGDSDEDSEYAGE